MKMIETLCRLWKSGLLGGRRGAKARQLELPLGF
jgi:hypothetical protein